MARGSSVWKNSMTLRLLFAAWRDWLILCSSNPEIQSWFVDPAFGGTETD
jgi:hypothetical protein